MLHLYVFYFFVTFTVGVVSLGTAYSAYIKTGETLIKYYLYFYSSFTLLVATNLLLAYFRLNIDLIPPLVFRAVDYSEAFIAKYLLMMTTPVFMHYLLSVPGMKRRNRIFVIIALCAFVVHHYFEFVTDSERVEGVGDIIDRSVFFSVMIYTLGLGIVKYRTIRDAINRSTAGKMLFLILVLLPGLVHDVYLNDYSDFRFFPVFYAGFSLIFAFHFVNKYFRHSPVFVPQDRLFQEHGISSREEEIVRLVLRGYSNQKIGKTLYISLNTVKSHVRNIFMKFNVKSRYELITLFKDTDRSSDSS